MEHNKPNWDKLQAVSVLTSDSPKLGPALKKNPYIEREREREREKKKKKLSVTPGHHTVQEGLSMVSCTESITKSKHVLYWKLFTPNLFP